MDGCHGQGSQHIAIVVGHGDDLLSFFVLVARVANAITPFLATVLVPSPWSTRRSSCFSAERWATLATNACHSDPSSAHLALDRPRARALAGLFPWPSSQPDVILVVSSGSPVSLFL